MLQGPEAPRGDFRGGQLGIYVGVSDIILTIEFVSHGFKHYDLRGSKIEAEINSVELVQHFRPDQARCQAEFLM